MSFREIKNIILGICVLITATCCTPKGIAYFQEAKLGKTELDVVALETIKIMPEDKLSIIVNCQVEKLTKLFNLSVPSKKIGQETESYSTSSGVAVYTVDSQGNIDFPVLGTLHIAGMTREQVAAYVKEQIESLDYAKNPVVTVEFVNFTVSVMGEVKNPGRINLNKDNMTILEALSGAGDLTIYGKRDNVMVMRNEDGKQHIYAVNLCSGSDVFSSPAYYLKQGDVVYVEPNGTRKRQSTVNGNNVRSTSFWMSLASFLTSIIVLIVK